MLKIKQLGTKISQETMKAMKGGLLLGGGGGCTEPQPVCCDGSQCSGSNGINPQVGTCGGWGGQM